VVFLEVSGLRLEVTRVLALICYSGAIFVMGAAHNERRDSAQVQLVSDWLMGCFVYLPVARRRRDSCP